jgi:hypothetical protein
LGGPQSRSGRFGEEKIKRKKKTEGRKKTSTNGGLNEINEYI